VSLRVYVCDYDRASVSGLLRPFLSFGFYPLNLHSFILSSCGGEKPQFLPFFAVFWTSAFSDVASCHQSQKVEHGCTTTNFPSPTSWKSFLYSNAFIAKSDAQTLRFKSVTDKQTDRQTDKELNVFGHPGGG